MLPPSAALGHLLACLDQVADTGTGAGADPAEAGAVPAVAIAPAVLSIALFLGLGRPSVKDWLSEP